MKDNLRSFTVLTIALTAILTASSLAFLPGTPGVFDAYPGRPSPCLAKVGVVSFSPCDRGTLLVNSNELNQMVMRWNGYASAAAAREADFVQLPEFRWNGFVGSSARSAAYLSQSLESVKTSFVGR